MIRVLLCKKGKHAAADMPSDPPFAGWARISTIKPADPRTFQMNPYLRICVKSAMYQFDSANVLFGHCSALGCLASLELKKGSK